MHRFDDQARLVFHFAREEALRLGHARVAPEHLLLGILRQDTTTSQVLKQLGLPLGKARNRLEELVGRREPLSNATIPDVTEAATLCMEAAAAEARRLQSEQIGLGHVLLGIVRQAEISTRQMTGGLTVSQILGELDGGLRGVMRHVIESLRSPSAESIGLIIKAESISLTLHLEPDTHTKIFQYAKNQNISLETAAQSILDDWAKR